jgi:hypothetical protein
MTGRKMPSRLDILSAPAARSNQESERANKMAQQFNRHHGAREREFTANEPIYYQLHQGNKWTWKPGKIIKRIGAANYLIQLDGRNINAHANQLKQRFISSSDSVADFSDSYINNFYLQQVPEAVRNEEIPVLADDSILTEGNYESAEEEIDNDAPEQEAMLSEPELEPEVIQRAPSPAMTRSGRNIRPPAYLNDFERDLDNAIYLIRKFNLAKI